MFRHWILSGLALLIFVASSLAWIDSYLTPFVCVFDPPGRSTISVIIEIENGLLLCDYTDLKGDPTSTPNVVYFERVEPGNYGMDRSSSIDQSLSGFGFGREHWHPFDGYSYIVSAPLWFTTTLSAAFLIYVWRKTRRWKPGRAFPVEMRSN